VREDLPLDMRDASGLTAFEAALQEDGEDDYIIEAFLNCYAVLPLNALKTAILSCANDEENASKVDLVLSRGASLEAPDFENRNDAFTALHLSASVGALKAARVILERDEALPLLNSQDGEGKTPLHYATSSRNAKMTKVLLEQGADLNIWNANGMAPVGDAIEHGNESLATLLLAESADIKLHASDYAGGSILHFAISKNPSTSKSMLVFLLSADIDEAEGEERRFPQLHDPAVLNATDAVQGNTALHLAAHFGDYAGVFALVAAGAATGVKNWQGVTPLGEARQRLQAIRSACESEDMGWTRSLEKCVRHLERVSE
jgi:ankyrin repeat protein